MYNEELENLIDAALADGVLTEKEKQVLFKKAQAMGIDLDEFEMVLDARLVKLKKAEQEKAASSAPKSNKLGDVKKCPSCGAMVQSYHGVCPECGYAFEGIDANSAVKELSSLLQKASSAAKMEGIIDNFPIPMEKASLLAFVTWLRPQSLDVNNPLAKSYQKKYAECVNKIRVSFANDKDLQSFVSQYEEDSKKIKKQRVAKGGLNILKKPIKWIILIVLIITCLIIGRTNSVSRNSKSCGAAIEKAIKKGNTQKAIDLYMNYDGVNKYKPKHELFENGSAKVVFDACLANGNFEAAKKLVDASGGKWDDSPFSHQLEEQMAVKLYDNCIAQGHFDTARELIIETGYEKLYYGRFIKDVVMQMCKNGDKDGAKSFVKDNVDRIDWYQDRLIKHKDNLKEYFEDIIDNY